MLYNPLNLVKLIKFFNIDSLHRLDVIFMKLFVRKTYQLGHIILITLQ